VGEGWGEGWSSLTTPTLPVLEGCLFCDIEEVRSFKYFVAGGILQLFSKVPWLQSDYVAIVLKLEQECKTVYRMVLYMERFCAKI
jgi:hypothetical protein